MIKLLSLMLSLSLIIGSVTPSLAQVASPAYDARALQESLHRQLDLSALNATDSEVLRQSRNMASAYGWVFSPRQEYVLNEINAIMQETTNQETPDACKITFPEFEKQYREASQSTLEEALKLAKNETERQLVKAIFNEEVEKRIRPAYEHFQEECPKWQAAAQKHYLSDLSEESSNFTRLVTRYQKINETMPRPSVDPIAAFLPLVYGAFGNEVVSKTMRERASAQLRKRIKEYSDKCPSSEKEEDCKVFVESLYALGILGTTKEDVAVLANELVKHYKDEGGIGFVFINTIGPALLGMKDLDPNYTELSSALISIINEGDEPTYWEASALKIENWVNVVEGLFEHTSPFTSKAYRNSFYVDNSIKNPTTGKAYDSKMSAWIDFGTLLGQESRKDPKLKSKLDAIVSYAPMVSYYVNGNNQPYVVTRHNLLLTGLLYGGYQVNVIPHEPGVYLDAHGHATQELGNAAPINAMKKALKERDITQSEFVAYVLYNSGYMDLEPGTSRMIKNFLAMSLSESTANRLSMKALPHPTNAEVALYNKYQPAKEIAAGTDKLIGFVAVFVASWILLDGVIFVAAKGLSYGFNFARAVRTATVLARTGRGASLSNTARIAKLTSRITFGANTPLKAFLQTMRGTRNTQYAVITELAGGERVLAAQFGLPEGAQIAKQAKKLSSSKKAAKAANLSTEVVDGTVYMVPQHMRLIRVGNQITYAGKGRPLTELAQVYGIEVSEVNTAVNTAARTGQNLYASAGEGFANAGKVQPVIAETPAAETVVENTVAQTTSAQARYQFNPNYVNALGQRTGAWEPLSLGVPSTTAAPALEGAWWQRMGWKLNDWWNASLASGRKFLVSADLVWNLSVKPTLFNSWRFATSRYGVPGLTAGGAPLTGTAAETAMLTGVETVTEQVVSNYAWLNQARLGWISTEEMFGAGGAGVKLATNTVRTAPKLVETAQGLSVASRFSRFAPTMIATPFTLSQFWSDTAPQLVSIDPVTGGLRFKQGLGYFATTIAENNAHQLVTDAQAAAQNKQTAKIVPIHVTANTHFTAKILRRAMGLGTALILSMGGLGAWTERVNNKQLTDRVFALLEKAKAAANIEFAKQVAAAQADGTSLPANTYDTLLSQTFSQLIAEDADLAPYASAIAQAAEMADMEAKESAEAVAEQEAEKALNELIKEAIVVARQTFKGREIQNDGVYASLLASSLRTALEGAGLDEATLASNDVVYAVNFALLAELPDSPLLRQQTVDIVTGRKLSTIRKAWRYIATKMTGKMVNLTSEDLGSIEQAVFKTLIEDNIVVDYDQLKRAIQTGVTLVDAKPDSFIDKDENGVAVEFTYTKEIHDYSRLLAQFAPAALRYEPQSSALGFRPRILETQVAGFPYLYTSILLKARERDAAGHTTGRKNVYTVVLSDNDDVFKALKDGWYLVTDTYGNLYKTDGTKKEPIFDRKVSVVHLQGLEDMPVVVLQKTNDRLQALNRTYKVMGFSSTGRFLNSSLNDQYGNVLGSNAAATATGISTGVYLTNLLSFALQPLVQKKGGKFVLQLFLPISIVMFGWATVANLFGADPHGWSTLAPVIASIFASGISSAAIQQNANPAAQQMLGGKPAGDIVAGGQLNKTIGSMWAYAAYAAAVALTGKWQLMYGILAIPTLKALFALYTTDLPLPQPKKKVANVSKIKAAMNKGNMSNWKFFRDPKIGLLFAGLFVFCGSETQASNATKSIMTGMLKQIPYIDNVIAALTSVFQYLPWMQGVSADVISDALSTLITGIVTMGPVFMGRQAAKTLMAKYKEVEGYNQKMMLISGIAAAGLMTGMYVLGPQGGLALLPLVIGVNALLGNMFTFAFNIMKEHDKQKYGNAFSTFTGTLSTAAVVGCWLVPTLISFFITAPESAIAADPAGAKLQLAFDQLVVPISLIVTALFVNFRHFSNPLNWKKPLTREQTAQMQANMLAQMKIFAPDADLSELTNALAEEHPDVAISEIEAQVAKRMARIKTEVSAAMGISESELDGLLTGTSNKKMTEETLKKVCQTLGLSYKKVLKGEENPELIANRLYNQIMLQVNAALERHAENEANGTGPIVEAPAH